MSVRPAMSKGCLGYMAREVTVPPSFVASRSWPLQMAMSLGGVTVRVVPQASSWVWDQPSAGEPKLVLPVVRETPQTVPLRSPERLPVEAGASKVSQNAGCHSVLFRARRGAACSGRLQARHKPVACLRRSGGAPVRDVQHASRARAAAADAVR
jgi:hypothetical protein